MKPPYKITNKILSFVASISEKIGQTNSVHLHRPKTKLRKENRIKTIQATLEIEGNSLTIEQITSVLENKRVIGTQQEIQEVKNAIEVYEKINDFNTYSLTSLCNAHSILMKGLVDSAGKLRSKSVGIVKGSEVKHIAPPGEMVKSLMNNLFNYLKNDDDLLLIKSCIFHYELEFIHPFLDGNGRIGRLWQTVILKEQFPIFEFLPIEAIIKERQSDYYNALGKSDDSGESTIFIEFMLEVLDTALTDLLKTQNVTLTTKDRIEIFKSFVKEDFFTRKDYLRHFKTISSSTASRDLKFAVKNNLIEKFGDKNTTKYRFIC